MKILLVTLLVIVGGCATAPEKEPEERPEPTDAVAAKTEFKQQRPLSYSASSDYYAATPSSANNVLSTESADRASNAEMREILSGKDPLAVMMTLCYQKNFEKAFQIVDEIFASHVNIPTYWNQIATCHLLQGNERKALLFYNKALELSSQYVPALNNIGVIYSKNRQDQKAYVAFQRALKNGKFTKTPRYNMAHLFLSYGLAEESLPLFQGLATENPADDTLKAGLANSYVLLGQWQEAWDQFSKIPDQKRKNPEIGLNMAVAAHKLGKTQVAKDIYSQVTLSKNYEPYAAEVRGLWGE